MQFASLKSVVIEMMECFVLYRGSLERSRLAFILESLAGVYSSVEFIWVFPGNLTPQVQQIFDDFVKDFDQLKVLVLNHTITDYLVTRRAIRHRLKEKFDYDLILVGDTASVFAPLLHPKRIIWFINGIPEEASMYSIWRSWLAWLQWKMYVVCVKPHIIVTVSKRMSRYVRRHFVYPSIVEVPTCVDVSTFRVDGNSSGAKGIFVYLGTGAPWQALDKLSEIWKSIHHLDKSIRFRVISRDPRTQVLKAGIPSTHIDFVQSNSFHEVAHFLHDCEVGFLIRRDNIVNRVSFPTKLGEYLAGGCWVVASNLDWDVSDYFDEYNIGLKVNPGLSASELAKKILDYRASIDWDKQSKGILECSKVLDRQYWLEKTHSMVFDQTVSE